VPALFCTPADYAVRGSTSENSLWDIDGLSGCSAAKTKVQAEPINGTPVR